MAILNKNPKTGFDFVSTPGFLINRLGSTMACLAWLTKQESGEADEKEASRAKAIVFIIRGRTDGTTSARGPCTSYKCGSKL